jgi:enoyl-CoA hydratase/carnithine racemase
MTSSSSEAPEISYEVRGRVAFITLNRPRALNSLSLAMLRQLHAALQASAVNPDIAAVFLRGAGDKAFCAGGDIRALYLSMLAGDSMHQAFFVEEYALDYFLHRYPKPYLALLDGITMGGGMGLAQGSPLRLVGALTRIAMPEVGIGLFPDVGASYFLSRLPGALGPYLALTGTTITANDALYAGLADLYLDPAAIAQLEPTLLATAAQSVPDAELAQTVRNLATEPPTPSTLAAHRTAIDAHFSARRLPEIFASLDNERDPRHVAWAQETLRVLRSRSPTMLGVTLRQLERGQMMTLADCFRMELGMVQECFVHGDLREGIRATIIDKDRSPRWRPSRMEDLSDADIDAFFRERWTPADHPLANLETNYP